MKERLPEEKLLLREDFSLKKILFRNIHTEKFFHSRKDPAFLVDETFGKNFHWVKILLGKYSYDRKIHKNSFEESSKVKIIQEPFFMEENKMLGGKFYGENFC